MVKFQGSRRHLLLLLTLLVSVASVSAEKGGDPCDKKPCKNGGTCQRQGYGDTYLCICPTNKCGPTCDLPKHPCVPNPCKHGKCCAIKNNTDYECKCDGEGQYQGKDCDLSVNPCDGHPNPCEPHGKCISVPDDKKHGYKCKCDSGYCGTQHCNQTCSPHCSVGCAVTGCGKCDGPCDKGYGLTKDQKCVACAPKCVSGCEKAGGGKCDDDSNPCNCNPCQHNGTCTPQGKTYVCSCHSGYTGKHCESPITVNPCNSHPCENGGTCKQTGTGNYYTCTCPPDYTGPKCQTKITVNPCNSHPCENGGTCKQTGTGNYYTCTCPPDYTGPKCQTKIVNHCSCNPCQYGGTCVPTATGYYCKCVPGSSGTHCEIKGKVP